MLYGAHILLYSDDAEADRAFLRDTLGLAGIDVGGGWLIFALPPAEVAVHPLEGAPRQVHAGHSLLGDAMADITPARRRWATGSSFGFDGVERKDLRE